MLLYRLLSCWLIIPAGALTYAALRRPREHSSPPMDSTIVRSDEERPAVSRF